MIRSFLFLGFFALLTPHAWAQGSPATPKRPLTLSALAPRLDTGYRDPGDVPPLPDKDGLNALFDGSRRFDDDADVVRPDPPEGLHQEIDIRNGQLSRLSIIYDPWGLTIRGGYLGLNSSRNDLVSESPYLSITKEGSSSGKYFDTHYALQTGIVEMNARYFNAGTDSEVDAWVDEVSLFAPEVKEYGANKDYYQQTTLIFNSALYQVGRAYNLYGPLDAGWAVTGLLKVTSIFPNAAANAAFGTRLRLEGDRSVGLFGGINQNISPIGGDMIQGLVDKSRSSMGYNSEVSPYVGLSFKGPLPGEEKIDAEFKAYRQYNRDTTLDKLTLSLGTDVGGRPTKLGAHWMHQVGSSIFEFKRDRRILDISRAYDNDVSVSIGYFQEDIQYGNVTVGNQGIMVGLKIRFGGKKNRGRATASYRSNSRDTYTDSSPPVFDSAILALNKSVSSALSLVEAVEAAAGLPTSPDAGDPAKNPERISAIASSIRNLDPVERMALEAALLAEARDDEERARVRKLLTDESLNHLADNLDRSSGILELLSKPEVLERFALRVARNRMADSLNKTEFDIPELGMKLRVTPGLILGAIQVLGNRPSPISPITASDSKTIIEPFLWKSIARNLGMPEDSSPEDIVAKYIESAPPAIREELLAYGTQAAAALGGAIAELLRTELNRMMIAMILAAEELNELTIGGNRQVGELGIDMLESSFERLDKRRLGKVYKRLAQRLSGRLDR